MHLTTMLKRAMTITGRDIATIGGERGWTWNECGDRVARLAGAVRNEFGLAKGDRAAILALNSNRYFELSHAMPWVGVVYVPINTRLAPPEIGYWLSDSGSHVLFVDDAFAKVTLTLRGALAALAACRTQPEFEIILQICCLYVVLLRILCREFPNIAYLHLIRPKPDRLLVLLRHRFV